MARTLDRTMLESLLLGKLPPEEAEPLLVQLEDKAGLAKLAAQLANSSDTLVDALRAQATIVEKIPEPRVASLIDRLSRMIDEQSRTAPIEEGTQFAPGKLAAQSLPFLAASQQADELGRLGGYRILKVLGQGGMGMVLLAEDPKLKRQVAIKVMKPEFAANEQAKERFLREARTTAQIEHDHVITVHQVGEEGGVPFLVMPLLKGETLDDRLRRELRPPLPETLRIGREIAEGLAAAHERGLIHRDIKPGNVWLESGRGRVKVLDFGLARTGEADQRLTQSGAVVGTPSYMAPEQASGERVDARCDLFSLGCILYQMTVGQKPFVGTTIMNILFSLANHHPAPPMALNPGVPPELSDLTMRLLSKRPDGRPTSAQQVAHELAAMEEQVKRPVAVPVAIPADDTEAPGPWAGIDDDTAATDPGPLPLAEKSRGRQERRDRPKSLPTPTRHRKAGGGMARWAIIGAGVLAVAIIVLFATGVIRIETPKGTLVIEGADDDVEVVIKQGGAIIKDKVKAREIELKVGDYTIELAEKGGGLQLATNKFTITRGDKTPIKVYLERALAKKDKPDIPNQPESLAFFNGKDLTGWDGIPSHWSVRYGALVGTTWPTGLVGYNTFLCSKKQYKDFELSFRIRLQGDKANSGVQIRSKLIELPKYIAAGPQADAGGEFWGSLYGERFGGMMRQAAVGDLARAAVKANDFNDYYIRCVGKKVTIKLNGVTTVDEEFENLPDEGIIAWQLHAGPPMEVEFRDIRFRDLSAGSPPVLKASEWIELFNGKDLTSWEALGKDGWSVADGILKANGDGIGWLATKKEYSDFELELVYRLPTRGNSGIFLRAWKNGPVLGNEFTEVQLLDDAGYSGLSPKQRCGAIYNAIPPAPAPNAPAGQWNKVLVRSVGRRVAVTMNGTNIIDTDLPGDPLRSGLIGLQMNRTVVEFRNIRVRDLSASPAK